MVGLEAGVLCGVVLSMVKNKTCRSVAPYCIIGGAGLTITGIPLMIKGMKRQQKAIDEYNKTLFQQNPTPKLSFGITSSGGVGLALNF
jgi:hypothetical protein